MNCLAFAVSPSAIGLYKSYMIALPKPNSARDKMVKILENSPSMPKYSAPRTLIKNVLHTNETINIITWVIIETAAFKDAFFVLDIDLSLNFPHIKKFDPS